MSDRDDFLAWVDTKLKDAEVALHSGDAGPRLEIWSRNDPVSVFGAWKSASGQADVRRLFEMLQTTFSDCTSYEHEVVAADVVGDMAYTVGYEHQCLGQRRPPLVHAASHPDLPPRGRRVAGSPPARGHRPGGRGHVGSVSAAGLSVGVPRLAATATARPREAA